jgi:hypothetical protein
MLIVIIIDTVNGIADTRDNQNIILLLLLLILFKNTVDFHKEWFSKGRVDNYITKNNYLIN